MSFVITFLLNDMNFKKLYPLREWTEIYKNHIFQVLLNTGTFVSAHKRIIGLLAKSFTHVFIWVLCYVRTSSRSA